MLSVNVFRNFYSVAENRLTYNFLCVLDLMTDGQAALLKFLIAEKFDLADDPLSGMGSVFAFVRSSSPEVQASNPDGCIYLRPRDGEREVPVFLEVKSRRRALTQDQLGRHVKCHLEGKPCALLLVVTPRASDRKVVQGLNDSRVIFVSWQQIADYLRKPSLSASDRKIADHFLSWARQEGEFMQDELETKDITLIIENHIRRPKERLKGAFERLIAEFQFEKTLHLERPLFYLEERWGCQGVNLQIRADGQTLKWIQFGIHDESEFSLKKDIPEIALFVDADVKLKESLRQIPEFLEAVRELEKLGWEQNLDGKAARNEQRLLFWRKPIVECEEINSKELSKLLRDRLKELHERTAFQQHYLSPT